MHEIGATTRNSYDPKLINGLIGAVTLGRNSDIKKFGYMVMELDLIEAQILVFQVVDLVIMH